VLPGVRLRPLVLAAALVLAPAAGAQAAPGLRTSLLGQTHAPLAGSPWAYYVRAWGADSKPWQGAIVIEVVTPAGKKLDGIGMFAFTGSRLSAYIWRRFDRGQTLDLRVTFLEGAKKVGVASYRVSVK